MADTEQTVPTPAIDSKAEESKDSNVEVPEAAIDLENLSDSDITFKWIAGRARTAFSFLKATTLRKSLESDVIKGTVDEYISKSEHKTLFFWLDRSSSLQASHGRPDLSNVAKNRTITYFIKTEPTELTSENMTSVCLVGELTPDLMDHLEGVLQDVFLPLVNNQNKREQTTNHKCYACNENLKIRYHHTAPITTIMTHTFVYGMAIPNNSSAKRIVKRLN